MEAGITRWEDYLVIGIYFMILIGVGLMSVFRKNRESVKGYFLAGRSMTWLPIGASLFASNIGSEHFIGLAGSGAASGIGVVSFEWGAVLLLMLLGWFFLPIYLTTGVFTMPEYLGRRFGGYRMRIYLSLVALVLYVVNKVSVDMYAGVYFIQLATGLNMYLSMIPLLAVAALYTIAGGLAAVVLTDTLQTVVMLVGAVVLAVMAFVEVGGPAGLFTKYMEAIPYNVSLEWKAQKYVDMPDDNATSFIDPAHCGAPPDDAFHMFRDPVTSNLPWPGVVFRATFASLWNWCADQVIVQRALAAKNMGHARGATILAGYLKLTPLFLIIMPGMISRILYPEHVACIGKEACLEACGNEAGCSNSAYPYLILKMAPVGMRGLMMAVMVAALMSSLTSIFNSAVTVFTMDLWRKARPKAKDKELIIVGRFFLVALVGVSIAWMPLVGSSQEGQLFMYMQAVTGYIAPPISAIFLLAIFVPRINEQGAFWGVLCGQAVGITRLVLDFVYPSPGCGKVDDRPSIVSKVHFTYFSIIVFVVTTLVAILVSLITPRVSRDKIENLTYWTLEKSAVRRKRERKRDDDTVEGSSIPMQTMGQGATEEDTLERRFKATSRSIIKKKEKSQGRVASSSSLADENFSSQALSDPTGSDSTVDVDASRNPAQDLIENIGEKFQSTVDWPYSFILNANAVALLACLAFLCGFFH